MGVSLLFVPYYVPIKFIFPGLCTLDMVGIIARWSRFDHVAHLSGAIFGAGYAYGIIKPRMRELEAQSARQKG
jgi:rhomboid-like protein